MQLSGHLVISGCVHPAVVQPAAFLERMGLKLTRMGVNGDGRVDPAEVEAVLQPDTLLVSVMHANNEIGVVQPIREIAELCRGRGVLVHTDAVQSVGKISTRVDDLGVDLLTVAGHKIYAPKGVGALYVRRRAVGAAAARRRSRVGHGGRRHRELSPRWSAWGCAASLAEKHLLEAGDRMTMLRDRLLEKLGQAIGPELSVNGERAPRLPNTLSANFPGVAAVEVLRRIPELCAFDRGLVPFRRRTHLSATLAAIGLDPDVARGAVRLSVGWYTDEDWIHLRRRVADRRLEGSAVN